MNWIIIIILFMNVISYLPKACASTSLPTPAFNGGMSLAEALSSRRSIRSFKNEELTGNEISQLLWSAQGISNDRGRRTAPSAGALYPLEVYVVTREGVSHYLPTDHQLEHLTPAPIDLRRELEDASLEQEAVGDAPAVFIIAADYSRTERKYRRRAEKYVKMEAGHACENLLLQATALDLGGVSIGAFDDDDVEELLNLPADEEVLYVVPIGRPG
eukprot:947319_1